MQQAGGGFGGGGAMRASTHPTAVLGGFYPTAGRGMMGWFGRAREGRGLGGQDFNAGFLGLHAPGLSADQQKLRWSYFRHEEAGGVLSGEGRAGWSCVFTHR